VTGTATGWGRSRSEVRGRWREPRRQRPQRPRPRNTLRPSQGQDVAARRRRREPALEREHYYS
jgi:hypothetical protein